MATAKNVVEYTCPRGRRNKRTITGRGKVTIRCSCGCRSEYTVTVK